MQGGVCSLDEVGKKERGLGRADRREAHRPSAVGPSVDNQVVVGLQVAAPALSEAEQQPVQVQEQANVERPCVLLVEIVQGGR